MDEKANNLRRLIWLNPITLLTIIDIIIIIKIKKLNLILYITKIIGAIFCQVNKINLLNQFNPSIISGNQKWNGAAPIFVNNAEFMIMISDWSKFEKICEFNEIKIILIKINIEAKAWVKKYFIAASVEYMFLYWEKRGIMEIKLISNPIHMPNQE